VSRLLWIMLGGALGTACRYGVGLGLAALLGPAVPFGTLAVNLLGSALMGLLYALVQASAANGPALALILGTGFLGGFTTFSAFSLDTVRLVEDGQLPRALLYLGLTVAGCLGATALGYALGQRAFSVG
jgi:CrcB protein